MFIIFWIIIYLVAALLQLNIFIVVLPILAIFFAIRSLFTIIFPHINSFVRPILLNNTLNLVLIILVFIIIYYIQKYMKNKQLYSKLILDEVLLSDKKDFKSLEQFIGREGYAKTDLKPVGFIQLNTMTLEAYSTNAYIRRNSKIKVINIINNNLIVEQIFERN